MKLFSLIALLQLFASESQMERWEQWVELGLHRPVLAEAEAALNGSSATPELFALAARAASASGETGLAQQWLSQREGAAIELERARLHLSKDRIAEALAILLAPSEPPEPRHPEHPDGWALAARALARSGELERARPLLEVMLARFPHDDEAPAALHLLSQAAITRGDLESAHELRLRAMEASRWRAFFDARRRQVLAHPKEPLPRFGVAVLWMEVGEAAKARDVLDELLKNTPEFARAHALRGDAARALGELGTSLSSWSLALELDEGLHAARLNRAIFYVSQSEWSKARADLEALIDLEEAREEPLVRAHLELAKVLEALGDSEGASAARARYRALTKD